MLFKVINRLLYMTSRQRLAILQRALEDAGMIARQYPPPAQLIELQTSMIHIEPKEPVSKETSFCTRLTQMIQQYF